MYKYLLQTVMWLFIFTFSKMLLSSLLQQSSFVVARIIASSIALAEDEEDEPTTKDNRIYDGSSLSSQAENIN